MKIPAAVSENWALRSGIFGLSRTSTYLGTLLRWFNTCWFAGWSLYYYFFWKGTSNFFSCTCLGAPAIWASWDYISVSPVPWQFLSSSPILQSSWPSQSHFSEMQRLLWHWNWSSAQRSSQPLCKQTQLKHTININDQSYVKIKLNNRNWNNKSDPRNWCGGDTYSKRGVSWLCTRGIIKKQNGWKNTNAIIMDMYLNNQHALAVTAIPNETS